MLAMQTLDHGEWIAATAPDREVVHASGLDKTLVAPWRIQRTAGPKRLMPLP